jgi:DNA-binding transcriptional regulator LsrR (DeoR family)
MLGRVAELHYKHGFTHQEVADLLGFSRVQVTRMLARARAEGIVEITVHSDEPIFPTEQQALITQFGLEHAIVSPTFADPADTLKSIGTVGASYLRNILRPDTTVAVGISGTLAEIARQLKTEPMDVLFVPAIGSRPPGSEGVNPHRVAELLADGVGGTSVHLPAPMFTSSAQSAETIASEPQIQQALETARNASVGLFGLGGTKPGSGIVADEFANEPALEQLFERGVVGDISAAFYDSKGRSIDSEISHRIVGLSFDEIMGIPHRVAFAGGPTKVDSIAGALAGGIITALVTDQETAVALLSSSS